jgi:hypothetical protein
MLKGFPRRPADVGVGMVESLRCHVQYHVFVWRLLKQFVQIYITVLKKLGQVLHQVPKEFDFILNLCGSDGLIRRPERGGVNGSR